MPCVCRFTSDSQPSLAVQGSLCSCRRWLLSSGLAVFLLAGLFILVGRAQGPDRPWLLRLPCRDEVTLGRLQASGMRLLLWQGGQVYALTDSRQRAALAGLGLAPEVISERAAQGDYFIVYASPAELAGLRARYGTVVPLYEGFYLLGLPPDASPLEPLGPRFARRLAPSLALPQTSVLPFEASPQPSRAVANLVERVSLDRLLADIAQLQDDADRPGPDALGSRFSLREGLEAEGAYIARELSAAGLPVSYWPFTAYDHSLQVSRPVSDIIAALPGLRPESEGIYVVCAHYDSTASREPDWYSQWRILPAPGADDNASGVAAVLEAARVLAGQPRAYGVRFILFAGEEQGLQGSQAYVASLSAAGARVLGAINLDMIAYDGNHDGAVELHAGMLSASQALADALARNMARYAPSLRPSIKTTTAIEASDHASFWAYGYPAVLAIEDWGHHTPYYHTAGDTLSRLDLLYCRDVVRATVGTIGELAQALVPDLATSQKMGAFDSLLLSSVAYTITLRNTGPVTASAALTDALDSDLTLQGPIAASAGAVSWNPISRSLYWWGAIAPQGVVTISYRALVQTPGPGGALLTNTALVDDGAGQVYALTAPPRMAWRWQMPAVVR